MQKLLDYGNRSGFTDLYLSKHNGPEMITFEAPSHTKAESDPALINQPKIKVNCQVVAMLGKEFQVRFTDENGNVGISKGNIIEPASKKPATEEDIKKAVSGLGNTPFTLEKLSIDYDDGIFLPVSVIKNTRRDAIEALIKSIEGEAKVPEILDFKKLTFSGNTSTTSSCFVTVSTKEQLDAVIAFDYIHSIAVPFNLFEYALDNFNGQVYIYLPTVLRDEYD